jgi:hypothetical protein
LSTERSINAKPGLGRPVLISAAKTAVCPTDLPEGLTAIQAPTSIGTIGVREVGKTARREDLAGAIDDALPIGQRQIEATFSLTARPVRLHDMTTVDELTADRLTTATFLVGLTQTTGHLLTVGLGEASHDLCLKTQTTALLLL